ncbi:DNA/RNA non-specific endonuclease [Candidatus Pacearchaeota archaeon]|nr:DNA/RNA non-specific endonuclease [Candidatus Pacearchaeota archaeon]
MRDGYKYDFLGPSHSVELPKPGLALQSDILQPPGLPDGEVVVPYINYSLLMSRSTRQALYSAANVNLDEMQTVPSKKGRRWFVDPRVGRENQIPNYSYQGTLWDRGHLTRRTAVTWGDNADVATKASNDSCAYTNACMQHKNFNEDEWRAVELLVSKFKLATKLTVMTGPVFTTTDRFYIKEFEDYPVRIPSAFWKIVVYVDKHQNLNTQAYIFFQDLPSVKSSRARSRLRIRDLQVTTTEVSLWTGLEFDQKLFDTNPLNFYSGPESISTKKHKELLTKDPDILQLDAGIVGESSINNARKEFPLDDFYELIDEISWV